MVGAIPPPQQDKIMTTNITFSNIYWNKSLRDYFFREQSWNTVEELSAKCELDVQGFLSQMDDATEHEDIDDVEENFYVSSIEKLAEEYDVPLMREEEEE